ncbi:hypothetical protein [Micromonospora humida]|uniref:hypothetical protein n=1 Tax=Micromonospora humida TaxID=2809018 RepID=UPI0034382116
MADKKNAGVAPELAAVPQRVDAGRHGEGARGGPDDEIATEDRRDGDPRQHAGGDHPHADQGAHCGQQDAAALADRTVQLAGVVDHAVSDAPVRR